MAMASASNSSKADAPDNNSDKEKFARKGSDSGENGERKRAKNKRRRNSKLASGQKPTSFEKKLLKLIFPSYYLTMETEFDKSYYESIEKRWGQLMDSIIDESLEDKAIFLFQLISTQEEDALSKIMTADNFFFAGVLRKWTYDALDVKGEQKRTPHQKRSNKELVKMILDVLRQLPLTLKFLKMLKLKRLNKWITNQITDSCALNQEILGRWTAMWSTWKQQAGRPEYDRLNPVNLPQYEPCVQRMTYKQVLDTFGSKTKRKDEIGDSVKGKLVKPLPNPEFYKQSKKIPLPLSRVHSFDSKPDIGSSSKSEGVPKVPSFKTGEQVMHTRTSDGLQRKGRIVGIHTDEGVNEVYYTVKLDNGNEVRANGTKLRLEGVVAVDPLAARLNKGKQKGKRKHGFEKKKMIYLEDISNDSVSKRRKLEENKSQMTDILGARLMKNKKKVETSKSKPVRTGNLSSKQIPQKSKSSDNMDITDAKLKKEIRWGDDKHAPKVINATYGGWGLQKFHGGDDIQKKYVVTADNSKKWHKPRFVKQVSSKTTDAVVVENSRVGEIRESIYLNPTDIPRTPLQSTKTPVVQITSDNMLTIL